MKLEKVFIVSFLLLLGLLFDGFTSAFPASAPEAAMENMRQIPQWHCLRYRKFDLVRRCRNYRIARKH